MSIFKRLLTKGEFWPLFSAQALGAFNDNFFRSALISLAAFAPGSPEEKSALASLAMAAMMLPFFLFSAPAGQVADTMPKSKLLGAVKAAELAIMLVAAVLLWLEQIPALLAVLFFMGCQSAFFGPLKYGFLPELLPQRELVAANGLISASTFLAIVLGSMSGAHLAALPAGPKLWLPLALVLVAALGLAAALRQPPSKAAEPNLKIEARVWRSTCQLIKSIRRQRLWPAVLAISCFWALGAVLMSQLPILVSSAVGGTPAVNTFLVTFFALGIALGSLGAQGLLKGRISPRLAPPAAGLMALFLALLAYSVASLPEAGERSVSLTDFISRWLYLRLALTAFLASLAGGVFVVPLSALVQHLAEPSERSRVIAANNIVNALAICLACGAAALLNDLGLAFIFSLTALGSLIALALALRAAGPEAGAALLRALASLLVKLIYRPQVKGLENLKELGEAPALVLANHSSFLDVALLIIYLPRRLTFAIDSHWAQCWWLKPMLRFFKTLPVNPTQPLGTRALIESLEKGETVVIFPEGRISTTGHLMKFYDGPGLIAAKTKAPLLPVIIDGPQYSRLGRLRSRLVNRPKFKVKMTVLPPRQLSLSPRPGESQRAVRHRAAEALFDLMAECRYQSLDHDLNCWDALADAARRCGLRRPILEDPKFKPLSYGALLRQAKVLGRRLAKYSAPGENVGLLLPGSNLSVCALFGLWAAGRTAVMLNFSQGPPLLASALATAEVKTIFSSRAFLESLGLWESAQSWPQRLICAEDLKLGWREKFASLFWRPRPADSRSPALILFTSGSEGQPKGVALSHRNLMSNNQQVICRLDFTEDDVMFNALPIFHSFGLNVGVVLPLTMGLRTFLYPTPLHAHAIPEMIYHCRATIAIASDTFASAWGRSAHSFDFSSLRMMIVGAEKLKEKTKILYADKLGVRIFEGYGVTETSPVLTLNSHLEFRQGSVGKLLPGVEGRLEPVEGVAVGGRLMVRGDNVMLGYIRPQEPGQIEALADGWHDTGDIVEIDERGFVWIRGRAKRFAKIGGEMVSLAAIEEVAAALWPGRPQAVVALEDEHKGEKLLYVSQEAQPDLAALAEALKAAGLKELSWPRQALRLQTVPMTPLGKINWPKLMEEVKAALA